MNEEIITFMKKVCQEIGAKEPELINDDIDMYYIDIPLKNKRSQSILIFPVRDTQYIRILSMIGRFQNLKAEVILEFNFNLLNGAFAKLDYDLNDGLGVTPVLAIVDCQRIDTVDYDELKDKIIDIAESADHFEKSIFNTDRT